MEYAARNKSRATPRVSPATSIRSERWPTTCSPGGVPTCLRSTAAPLEHAVPHTTPERLSHAAVSTQHVTARDNIPPPSDAARLAGDVDAIISRAMRIDPADRYPSMEALVADLRRWMERRPIAARREDRSYRTRLWLRRNWLPVNLTTTLFVALGAGLALSVWQYERARAEASRANKTADYLVELLGRADPDLHGGKWPSALDLLDEAARDSKLRFRDEPVTEERLARLFAGIYRSLSRDSDALPLARRAGAFDRFVRRAIAEHPACTQSAGVDAVLVRRLHRGC